MPWEHHWDREPWAEMRRRGPRARPSPAACSPNPSLSPGAYFLWPSFLKPKAATARGTRAHGCREGCSFSSSSPGTALLTLSE